ncbi:MAG: DUF1974 domain-containing protein, partial [Pseudomonadota bacterium]
EAAFLGHVGFAVSNIFGALFHNVTGGVFTHAPKGAGDEVKQCYKQLARASRNFALVADMTVALLGGGLKRKQKVTGRLADALSELYILSCTLKRFEDDGKPEADEDLVLLAMSNGMHRFERALLGAINNFPVKPARLLLRWLVFPFGRHYDPADDDVGQAVVRRLLEPGSFRDRLTRDIFVSKDVNDPTGLLEVTLEKAVAAEAAEKKLDRAVRDGVVRRFHGLDWFQDAVDKGVLTQAEADQLREVEMLTDRVIAVDHFDPAEVRPNFMQPGHNARASLQAEAAE